MTCQNCEKLERELLSAQAAIEKAKSMGWWKMGGEWQELASIDLSLLHQRDAEREHGAIKRLSDTLTNGNASTWDEIFHAAESASTVRKPLVELLTGAADAMRHAGMTCFADDIDDALAKVAACPQSQQSNTADIKPK